MKERIFKQLACVSENDAANFENKANDILAQTPDPEIIIDQTRPFTMYVLYKVSKNVPESALELLELLDPNGGHATCEDCDYFIKDKDHRKKWGICSRKKGERTHINGRACEFYYLELRKDAAELIKKYEQIPYKK